MTSPPKWMYPKANGVSSMPVFRVTNTKYSKKLKDGYKKKYTKGLLACTYKPRWDLPSLAPDGQELKGAMTAVSFVNKGAL